MPAKNSAPKRAELPQNERSDENSVPAHAALSGMDAIRSQRLNRSPLHSRRGLLATLILLNVFAWIVIALVLGYAL
jgi:hypothetical protein